jgi:hypothetical protein
MKISPLIGWDFTLCCVVFGAGLTMIKELVGIVFIAIGMVGIISFTGLYFIEQFKKNKDVRGEHIFPNLNRGALEKWATIWGGEHRFLKRVVLYCCNVNCNYPVRFSFPPVAENTK